MSTTPGTTRPPLSPAAQAVLDRAKEKPWGRYDQEQFVSMLAVSCNTIDEARAYAEAITASVNVYARDRELLAMAREKLEYIRSEARASDNTFDWAAPNHLRAVLHLATEALAALGTEA